MRGVDGAQKRDAGITGMNLHALKPSQVQKSIAHGSRQAVQDGASRQAAGVSLEQISQHVRAIMAG